jgi:MFS family permease
LSLYPLVRGGDIERKTVLAALVLAMFILVIDTTIMNVSISALIEEFNTNVATVQAAITLYALIMASFMITGGKIGDIIGRKKAFRLGLIVYSTGSLLTSISPTMAVLFLGWSILEGFGATLVMPAIQTLVTSNYSGKDRALAYGIIGGIVAGAIALGPIIGGWLTTWYTWRLAFAGEVVIVIIVLILSRYILDAPLETEERPKLDIIGTIFSALGVGLIVFGVLLAGVYGWWKARQPYYIGGVEISPLGLSPTPVFIFTGVIILLFFAFWERHVISRGKMPLIRLDVLRDRGVTSGVFTQTVQTLLFGGFLFSMALFFQVALGLNAIQTGFLYLPLSLPLLIASLAASRLSSRMAPKIIIQAGLLILIAGLFLSSATINIEVRGPGLMTGFALIGTGWGLIASQVMNLVLSQVLPERTSETAALMSASQNLGMSLRTALMGSIVIAGLVAGATALMDESTVIPEDLKPAVISSVEENAQFLSDEELQAVLQDAPPEVSQEILRINENVRIEGIKTSLWGLVIFAVVGLIVSIFLPPEILVSKKE